MKNLEIIFWSAFAIVFYSFVGYGIVLWIAVKLKGFFVSPKVYQSNYQPEVTLVVPCYNEAEVLDAKVANSLHLDYPASKLKIIFITDGSTDDSAAVLAKHPQVSVLHVNKRGGKTAAENRVMGFVTTPVVIFSDANTLLNPQAVKNITRHFAQANVGCVAGEKRIATASADIASAAGEGLYWKYESFLKKLDSQLYSAVGAAGELVAFRTRLYEPIPEDTILDDFIQSMYIAAKGFRIVYEPDAFAMEKASASVKEELKRKVRICAGGWQSMQRLTSRLSLFSQPVLYFQYVSHRVLRWTINPFLLISMLGISAYLSASMPFFKACFGLQIFFYVCAMAGFMFEARSIKLKAFFVPYYFCVMNYAVVAGLWRYLLGSQSSMWEKNRRMAAA